MSRTTFIDLPRSVTVSLVAIVLAIIGFFLVGVFIKLISYFNISIPPRAPLYPLSYMPFPLYDLRNFARNGRESAVGSWYQRGTS